MKIKRIFGGLVSNRTIELTPEELSLAHKEQEFINCQSFVNNQLAQDTDEKLDDVSDKEFDTAALIIAAKMVDNVWHNSYCDVDFMNKCYEEAKDEFFMERL